MSLPPASRLGPYEVISWIGAGGMGEVYKARDTRLIRNVALKTLPELLAADTDRLRRFTLEAQSASSLNDPNIVAIHDIGTHEGTPSGRPFRLSAFGAWGLGNGASVADLI